MKSLKRRLRALDQRFSQTSAAWQLELLCRGIGGDPQALDEFALIAASGRAIPLLEEMFHQFRAGLVVPQTAREKVAG